jgi:transcription elongation factor Elf1
MGMYDTIKFLCPRCDEEIWVQSKGGEREMAEYEQDSVPYGAAQGVIHKRVTCSKCNRDYSAVILLDPPKVVRMGLVRL